MKCLWLTPLFFVWLSASAQSAFTGTNFSGIYDCTGQDNSEGAYTGKVTIHLVKEKSAGEYGAYQFKLEVPGFGAYPGHATARKNNMAIYFANTDASTKDFGTCIANVLILGHCLQPSKGVFLLEYEIQGGFQFDQ